jgi:hypothetical protein
MGNDELRSDRPALPLAAGMTTIAALVSAGFSIASIAPALHADRMAGALSLYAASRSVSLALVTVALVVLRRWRTLAAVAIVHALIQACDAFVGVYQHDVGKTAGPAVLAVATLLAARVLLRQPR